MADACTKVKDCPGNLKSPCLWLPKVAESLEMSRGAAQFQFTADIRNIEPISNYFVYGLWVPVSSLSDGAGNTNKNLCTAHDRLCEYGDMRSSLRGRMQCHGRSYSWDLLRTSTSGFHIRPCEPGVIQTATCNT
ncbi:hypothetical protein GDO78_022845 [Eleutherodactylus coqui]|uniref:Uncharacterized protein n=1 Tax=Eleutherodactylus coqui TaxID=57060 RepID=A0A8J6EFP8_ELECQ|nr:hypothetical protein GDO78_022845 [Eleutherodactylus coqui]